MMGFVFPWIVLVWTRGDLVCNFIVIWRRGESIRSVSRDFSMFTSHTVFLTFWWLAIIPLWLLFKPPIAQRGDKRASTPTIFWSVSKTTDRNKSTLIFQLRAPSTYWFQHQFILTHITLHSGESLNWRPCCKGRKVKTTILLVVFIVHGHFLWDEEPARRRYVETYVKVSTSHPKGSHRKTPKKPLISLFKGSLSSIVSSWRWKG